MDCAELKSRAVSDFVWDYRALACVLANASASTCVAELLERFQNAEITAVVRLPFLNTARSLSGPYAGFKGQFFKRKAEA